MSMCGHFLLPEFYDGIINIILFRLFFMNVSYMILYVKSMILDSLS